MSSPQHEPGNHWSLIPAILGFCTAAMGFLGHRRERAAKAIEGEIVDKCPNLMSELTALEKRHGDRFERIETAQALDRKTAEERHHELFQLIQSLGSKNAS